MPHVLDDRMSAGNLDVFFPAAGRAGRSHVLIGVAAGADDRRIAAPAGQLERQSAGRRDARHFSFFVERRAVDGAGRRKQNAPHGCELKFWLDAEIGGTLLQLLDAFAASRFGLRFRIRRGGLPVRIGQSRSPPVTSELNSFHSSQILRERSVSRFSRGNPIATANRSAPSPTSMTWPVCSITALATIETFLILRTPPTEPARRVGPCMQQASSSTTPSSLGKPPRPTESSLGSSSGPFTTRTRGIERVSAALKESVSGFDVGVAVVGAYDDRTLGCIALRCVPLLAVLRNSSVCSHACGNSSEH